MLRDLLPRLVVLSLLLLELSACSSGSRHSSDAAVHTDAGASSDAASSDAASSDAAHGGSPLGAACAGDTDCADPDGVCLTDRPNGYCSKGCAVSDCTEGFCYSTHMGTTTTSLCMVSCTSDTDCRVGEGYHCAIVGFGVGVCDQ